MLPVSQPENMGSGPESWEANVGYKQLHCNLDIGKVFDLRTELSIKVIRHILDQYHGILRQHARRQHKRQRRKKRIAKRGREHVRGV